MFFFFFDNESVKIDIGNSPKQADIAIAPIANNGSIGLLNEFVLKEYGYNKTILNNLNLDKGFDLFQSNGKPILFVVTVDKGNTENNLKNNLRQAITINFDNLSNKKVWIPLLGTGGGGLSYFDSYNIITSLLEELKDYILKFKCEFIISIPNDDEGEKLYISVNRNKTIDEILNENNNYGNITEENAKRIIDDSKANFYLVGTSWDGDDQAERFYEQGIWENGYDDGSYSDRINKIKVNDILIHKSTFSQKGKSILRVKAFGIVTRNYNDGVKLEVDWKIVLKENKDFEGLGFYRDTIAPIKESDLITIFTSFKSEEFEELYFALVDEPVSEKELESKNTTKLAGLIADIDDGDDHLDIKADVEAFARVMAAKSFQPPLSIALLGKWGSGKSFFMQKLKKDIQKLSERNPQKVFCEGIAHVHFNAWSYMDANLWASIVTRIFEGLQEYISGDSLANKNKKEIEAKLTKNLNIAKEEIDILQKQNENIKAQIEKLNSEKESVENSLNEKIDSIRKKSIKEIIKKIDNEFQIQKKIKDTLNDNPTFVDSVEKFKKIIPEKYWFTPTELYNQVKSKYTFIKVFFKPEKWWKNCLWALSFIIIIFVTPIFTELSTLIISWTNFTLTANQLKVISIIGAFYIRAYRTYLKLKPVLASFWKIKEDYEKEKENALFEYQQKEKALLLEIEKGKNEINSLNEQINKANVVNASIEFKLQNALSTEALYTFIEKRANSEDYKKHLGIVSIIRKDFEVLNSLLVDHSKEIDKNKESSEFRAMFEKPLERIILYIDDLDRCPEERVVEVLEAVNLLMAFPLFVVVVGVDPRWVKNALIKKHQMQFTGHINGSENSKIEIIEASNYLEKIFQVPFHLKDAEDSSIKNMIEKLAGIKPLLSETININTNETNNSTSKNKQPLTADIEDITIDREDININDNLPQNSLQPKQDLLNEDKIDALEITPDEVEQIKNLTGIIGNNPRSVKRFVNIYRIIKTHEDFDEYEANNENKLLAVMFLLAFSIGRFNKSMKEFEDFICLPQYSSYTLINLMSNFPELLKAVENNESIMRLSFKDFTEHYQFIKRFTFKNI